MTEVSPQDVFVQIDDWYARAPANVADDELVRWVQHNAEIPCPRCGDLLWVLRTRRARDPSFYHLAMCQNEDCTFQIDD